MPSWPGDPTFESRLVDAIARGEDANVSRVGMCAHSGTHVDAPLHFFQSGAAVDSMPLDVLVGPCIVAEVPVAVVIRAADLAKLNLPEGTTRLLLKTPNSTLWHSSPTAFAPDFVGLAPDAAAWVVQRGIRLLGVDYLSVEPYPAPPEHPVHRRGSSGGDGPQRGLTRRLHTGLPAAQASRAGRSARPGNPAGS
jgi:arylformamidase